MAQAYADIAFLEGRVPATAAVDPGPQQDALDDAAAFVSLSTYLAKSDLAHAYYAAHLLACRFPEAMGVAVGVGAVSALAAGEISASFAAPALAEDQPNTTEHGRKYLALKKGVLPRYQVG